MADPQKENELLIDLDRKPIVFDYISNGITITDEHSTILYLNPAFTRITGYTVEEAMGNNPGILHSGRHDVRFYKAMWSAILEQGFWEGEIWNRRKSGEVYPEFLTISKIRQGGSQKCLYVAIFSDISYLKRDIHKTLHLAFYDPLTELPNRALYLDRLNKHLEKVQNNPEPVTVFYMDLDKFKPVNDQYGHCVGDKLLKMVGERLAAITRSTDTVARLGGDEFAAVLTTGSEGALRFAKDVLSHLANPFEIDGHLINISISMGFSICPTDGTDIEILLARADHAMYRAKKNRSQIEPYNREIDG